MDIEFDPEKRKRTLEERGLDFESAREVFRGPVLDILDERQDYGEPRTITFGLLGGPHGGPGLDTAWRGPPHHFHEVRQ